jgi:hypothetical protein
MNVSTADNKTKKRAEALFIFVFLFLKPEAKTYVRQNVLLL